MWERCSLCLILAQAPVIFATRNIIAIFVRKKIVSDIWSNVTENGGSFDVA